jgi:hypothetical protein
VKGLANNQENNLADEAAHSTAHAFSLGLIKPAEIPKGIVKDLDDKQFFDSRTIVNKDIM